MNNSSFWIVILVASAWIAFLMGYSMSAHTGGGVKTGAAAEHAPVSAGAGGYGGAAPAGAGAGGYGR